MRASKAIRWSWSPACPPGEREFLLYLPLYNGVSAVAVGVPADGRLQAAPARPAGRSRPVVFYGTSIAQGGCASRPWSRW